MFYYFKKKACTRNRKKVRTKFVGMRVNDAAVADVDASFTCFNKR
jgi:hypothetical protein